MVRDIRVTVEDDEFRFLKQVKGDRPWRDALLDEFGYEEDKTDE